MLIPDEFFFFIPEQPALESSTGGFAKMVWVLALAEPESAGNREFLSKVLAAANLNFGKDTLFAEIPAQQSLSFSNDIKRKQPAHVLVFGLPPAQLGLTIEAPLYQPLDFYGVNWLFADALSALEPDKTKKSRLWAALKQIFLP